jgi:hypothetical protein
VRGVVNKSLPFNSPIIDSDVLAVFVFYFLLSHLLARSISIIKVVSATT